MTSKREWLIFDNLTYLQLYEYYIHNLVIKDTSI